MINVDPWDDEKNGIDFQLNGLDVWLVYESERNRRRKKREDFIITVSSDIESKQT